MVWQRRAGADALLVHVIPLNAPSTPARQSTGNDNGYLMSDWSATRQSAAAMTEEPLLLRQGVDTGDRDFGHASGAQPGRVIARQFELPVFRVPAAGEKTCIGLGARQHHVAEVGGDFVGTLADAWANRGDNPLGPGAQSDHRGDRGFDDAGNGASPAGMRRAGDSGARVREQNRCAVGGDNAKRQARTPGDHRVSARSGTRLPGSIDFNNIDPMNLRAANEA